LRLCTEKISLCWSKRTYRFDRWRIFAHIENIFVTIGPCRVVNFAFARPFRVPIPAVIFKVSQIIFNYFSTSQNITKIWYRTQTWNLGKLFPLRVWRFTWYKFLFDNFIISPVGKIAQSLAFFRSRFLINVYVRKWILLLGINVRNCIKTLTFPPISNK